MTPNQQRRAEEKQRRRDEILDAAEIVFSDRGFDAATMDDVAVAARVSRALVYVYFRDKRALHLGVCERALELLRTRFVEAVTAAGDDGRSQLSAIGRCYIAFAEQQPCYFNALSFFEATDADDLDNDLTLEGVMRVGRRVHEVTVASIERGMRDGSLRTDITNPMQTAMTLWGFTHGALQIARHKAHLFRSEGIDIDAYLSDAVELATRALEPRQ